VLSSILQAAEDRTKLRCVRNNVVLGWKKKIAEKSAIAANQERLPTVPKKKIVWEAVAYIFAIVHDWLNN
jgi:hypothetical protein